MDWNVQDETGSIPASYAHCYSAILIFQIPRHSTHLTMTLHTPSTALEFDHLVVMMRDELTQHTPALEADGYFLTPLSVHNLGSMNRLITLDSTYIELLGWPSGQKQERQEIANQPLGLDALVFRSYDAHADHARLLQAGFKVNPVQHLERDMSLHGTPCTARFETLRFAEQPIEGIRMYFCQHLTPELVWDAGFMNHANGVHALRSIELWSPDAQKTAQTLAVLLNAQAESAGNDWIVALPNLTLQVTQRSDTSRTSIHTATVCDANGTVSGFNTHLPARNQE